jgi:hypothetical protein
MTGRVPTRTPGEPSRGFFHMSEPLADHELYFV